MEIMFFVLILWLLVLTAFVALHHIGHKANLEMWKDHLEDACGIDVTK